MVCAVWVIDRVTTWVVETCQNLKPLKTKLETPCFAMTDKIITIRNAVFINIMNLKLSQFKKKDILATLPYIWGDPQMSKTCFDYTIN